MPFRSTPPALTDDFRREPPFPPDYLFAGEEWSGVGDLDDLRGLERRLTVERLLEMSYVRLHARLGYALLTTDMQHRWKKAYLATTARNQRLLEEIAALGEALQADGKAVVLLEAAAALALLHEDPGTRPIRTAHLLVAPGTLEAAGGALRARGFTPTAAPAPGGALELQTPAGPLRCRLHTTLAWRAAGLDAAAVLARTRPLRAATPGAAPPPIPHQTAPIEFVAAIEIAAPPAGVAAERPAIMRPVSRAERSILERVRQVEGVRVPAPADLLLEGLARWAAALPAPPHGLRLWELSELTRVLRVDWDGFVRDARRLGLSVAAHHGLERLVAEWRASVPEAVPRALRPGLLLSVAMGCAQSRPGLHAWLVRNPLRLLCPGGSVRRAHGGFPAYLRSLIDPLSEVAE